MILAPQLLQYIIVQYASRPLRITIYNCTNSVLGVGGGSAGTSGVRGVSFFLVVGAFSRLQLRRKPDSGPESVLTHLPTQVFSYVVDKVLGGKLWPRE